MKYRIEKDTVRETLVITLYGRKVRTQLYPNLYKGETATRLMEQFDCDFSRLENKACVSSVIGNARVFSSLNTAFFNLRFTLSSDVPKNTDTVLATLPEVAPLCFSPLSVHIGGNSSHSVGYMTYQSEIGFKCETDVKAGTWVYINGAVINNLSSDAE